MCRIVPREVEQSMRKNILQFTRLPNSVGRLGIVTAAMMSAGPYLGSSVSAQSPKTAQSVTPTGQRVPHNEGTSSREARESAIQRIPFGQLTNEASARLRSVIDNASYFRRMPTETVECDQEMYAFLVRHPEVVVNIWEVMGVTKVSLQRLGPYQLRGNDGAGTSSNMDLVFGNDSLHIYHANGAYQGNLWPRELSGKCVVLLHNRPASGKSGDARMVTSMDVFMKLDNVGADLVVKTLGPLVGKTADYNFSECASFFAQISQTAQQNPFGLQQLAKKLNNVEPRVRDQFVATTLAVSQRNGTLASQTTANPPLTAKAPSVDAMPEFILGPRVPPVEQSTRRRPDTTTETEESRVESPTILLIGKDEKKSP
jgi:hypothetical protein